MKLKLNKRKLITLAIASLIGTPILLFGLWDMYHRTSYYSNVFTLLNFIFTPILIFIGLYVITSVLEIK